MGHFKKTFFCIASGTSLFILTTSVALATAPAPMLDGTYIGAFGGWGRSNSFDVTQSGVAFFTLPPLETPLPVDATGDADKLSIGFGGLHVGHEWTAPCYKDRAWALMPAMELEGLYFKKTADAEVVNLNPRLGAHTFADRFPMSTGLVLVNGVVSLNDLNSQWHPYLGVGLGAARISISGADSLQVNPPELGVNHFNSKTGDADWTFAAQAKLGVRYAFNPHWRIFAEYRMFYVGNTNFTFGSTRYPTHVETTSWVIDMDNTTYNTGTLGVEWSI